MRRASRTAAAVAALLLLGTAQHARQRITGTFAIAIGSGPFISGSRVPLTVTGAPGRTSFDVSGPGNVSGSIFNAPQVGQRTSTGIIGAAQGALAYRDIEIVPPPQPSQPLLAVASYDNGIALHDPRTFALIGFLAIGGPPGDVALANDGSILAPDTDGNTLAWFRRKPWTAQWIDGVALGNEVATDTGTGNAFVSNRDVNGMGAVTRITPDGTVQRVVTGVTAEGLAVDGARGTVYTGNVNDNTVAEVDAKTMTIVRKLHSAPRTFGMALDDRAGRLYVVANISPDMKSGKGYVAALNLRAPGAPVLARSPGFTFPIGVALDARGDRLFVSDEAVDVIYVLDAKTLRPVHEPLRTCRTPWRIRIFHDRLYVPCARSNAVDAIDVRTLKRVPHAPFATGGFPLSVAVWP